MDLLGDLGATDQLTSAREENKVLAAKVKELSVQVKTLMIENQALLAEVEMYRTEAALPNFSKLALGQAPSSNNKDAMMDLDDDTPDAFIKSGNGVFPSDPAVTLKELNGNANPLCCALHPNDTLLASGGADRGLTLCQWGSALAPTAGASDLVVKQAIRLEGSAPVICVAFAQEQMGKALPVIAAGCMDGSIMFAGFGVGLGVGLHARRLIPSTELKFAKYVKGIAWSPHAPILAAASADGNIVVVKVSHLLDSGNVTVDVIQKLHLSTPVESICFAGDTLIVYARDTPYLSYFNLEEDFEHVKINLNTGSDAAVGGFEDHVSFAVMDMMVSPNGKFLALATDASRNIVMDVVTGKHIRNLYGHQNDGFSNPKIGWSSNGQYVLGNTQEGGVVCVWDVASTDIVMRLEGHTSPIRGLFSSKLSDTLVTTAFDKQTKIWLTSM